MKTVKNSSTDNSPIPAYQVNQMLVALELGVADGPVLEYLDFFSSQIPVASAYFLHVVPKFDVFNSFYEQQAGALISNYELNEEVLSSMRRRIEDRLLEKNMIKGEFDVREGNPLEELLHDAKDINADLLIIGQRSDSTEHGIEANQFARNLHTNALIIPDQAKARLSHLLVPVDFSKNAIQALQLALSIREQAGPEVRITCLNVYDTPNLSIYKINRTREELSHIIRKDREQAFDAFLKKHTGSHKNEINIELIERETPGTAHYIRDFALEKEVDMILIGAKGHSKVERLLLGSVTEHMISKPLPIPCFIVKEFA